ncbi:MAG: Methionyl-tRNA formyltransferase [Firmicutes bacterium]|nr:Methionyl-tRNA formyltransferase [Bacillota bacterium]
MRKLRIVFMGTPDFAVPCLDRLVRDEHQIIAVVTQPDRPKGRGRHFTPSPVKEYAQEYNLPVLQPEKIKDPGFMEQLAVLQPDVIVVVAFGQFLPQRLLDLPSLGCINVHASLLPKYRGAAPIHWAIMNGETSTGVTTMYMDSGMDTGDMILKRETPISPDENTGQLHDRLSSLGAGLLAQTLELAVENKAPRTPQNSEEASYAPLLTRQIEAIDWKRSAMEIHNQVRGLNPWPGAYCLYNDRTLKIWRTHIQETVGIFAAPGCIVAVERDCLLVAAGNGTICIDEVQPQNKRRMGVGDFSTGYRVNAGEILE